MVERNIYRAPSEKAEEHRGDLRAQNRLATAQESIRQSSSTPAPKLPPKSSISVRAHRKSADLVLINEQHGNRQPRIPESTWKLET
ncbi:unnamed protein product, partial [Iphiclides podalirius]